MNCIFWGVECLSLTQNIRSYKIEPRSLYVYSNPFWKQRKSAFDKSDFQNVGTVLTRHQWSLCEASVNIFRKPIKHFKRIERKANLTLCHIQIGKLAWYGYIVLIVVAKNSLHILKQIPEEKPGQKSVTHTRFWFSQCAQKSAAFGRIICASTSHVNF